MTGKQTHEKQAKEGVVRGLGGRLLAISLGLAVVWGAAYLILSYNGARALNSSTQETPSRPDQNSVQNLSSFVGQLLYRCSAGGRTTYCVQDAQGRQAELTAPAIYEQAEAGEAFLPGGARSVFSRPYGGGFSLFLRESRSGAMDQLTGLGNTDLEPAVAPDGRTVAYVVRRDEYSSIWLYDLGARKAQPLTADGAWHDSHPTWSPDGKQVVFASDRDGQLRLYAIDIGSRSVTPVSVTATQAWAPVWVKPLLAREEVTRAPGGAEALYLGLALDEIYCTVEISVGDSSGALPIQRVALFADEELIHESGRLDGRLYQIKVNVSKPGQLRVLRLQAWNGATAGDAPAELTRPMTCQAQGDQPIPATVEAPATLTPVIVTAAPTPVDVFDAATRQAEAAAQIAAVGTPTATPPNMLVATSTATRVVIQPTSEPSNQATATYAALAATARAATTGTPTPYPTDAVTATPTPTPSPTAPPTATPRPTATPVWMFWQMPTAMPTATPLSPLPRALVGKVLFRSSREGDRGVFVVDPTTGKLLGQLTDEWPYEIALEQESWSRDRQFMTFVRSDNSGSPQIFVHDFKFDVDIEITRMGAGASWEPAPDASGWRIAFVSNEPGNDELFIINRDGTDMRRLTHNDWEWDRHPSWSPDGSEIVFWSNRDGLKKLYVLTLATGKVRSISDGLAEDWDPVWVK